jgi:hypothetical protein
MALPKGLSVVTHNNIIVAKLYDTKIVISEGNKVTLNSGGWLTNHTKKCMNLVLANSYLNVSQKKGQWFVTFKGTTTVPFEDGMTVTI